MAGSPVGLQQMLRVQGLEWGDSANHDYHLWFDGGTIYTDALFSPVGGVTPTDPLVMTQAVSKLVAGSTSFSIRNHADQADNVLVSDAGLVTLRSGITFTGATTTIQSGASELRLQSPDGTIRQLVVTNDGIGMGGAYPGTTAVVQIGKTWTDPSVEIPGVNVILQYALTTNNTQILHGFTINPRTSTSDTNNYGTLDGLNVEPWVQSASGTITEVKGIWNIPSTRTASAANVTTMNGTVSQPTHHGSGVVTTMNGTVSQTILDTTGGNITTQRAYYAQVQNNNASSTTTTGIGYFVTTPVLTGAVTTNYGVYVADQGDSTQIQTSYGIYISAQTQSATASYAIRSDGGQVWLTATQTLPSATSLSWDGFRFNQSTLTITGNTGSPITTLAAAQFHTPTITDASAVTVTTAATVMIQGAPTAAGSVTITNNYALYVAAGTTRFEGHLTGKFSESQVSAAGSTWAGFNVATSTLTLTGGVNVTGSLNLAQLNAPTITSASATVVTSAATLAIPGPPVVGGSVTFTNATSLYLASGVGIAAGGTAASVFSWGLTGGNPAGGFYFGSSAPTIAAPKGSIYSRTDGSSSSTRLYVNTDGSTTWTAVSTVA